MITMCIYYKMQFFVCISPIDVMVVLRTLPCVRGDDFTVLGSPRLEILLVFVSLNDLNTIVSFQIYSAYNWSS